MTTGPESDRERHQRHYQRTLFDGIAERYEVSRPGYPAHVVEFVTATARLRPGVAVLEIGCGTGQTGAEVSFQVTSFEDLTAADASFALVVCSAAFHWIDPEVAFSKSARLLRPGGWLALLGTEEHYDDPLGAALDVMWDTHGNTGGAWERRLSDPEAVAATGLFGTPACLSDRQQIILPAGDVIALESTRATFLSWPHDTQRHFTEELRRLPESQPAVSLARHTSVTMAAMLCV